MGYDQHYRDSVDLGSGMVRDYFSERFRWKERAPVARKMDKQDACLRRSLAGHNDAGPNSYAAPSACFRRPIAICARFVLHATPTALQPDDHRRLADIFGVAERALGVRILWKDAS